MKPRRPVLVCLLVPALPLLLTASAWAQAPQYVVQDLGALGGISSTATALNNAGQVVGYSYDLTTNLSRAGLFIAGSSPQDLGSLGAATSHRWLTASTMTG